ncbi:MAG: hypothetical protein J6N72_06830, partial [Psychrobacter sp.]|nr:hypothetical protein [Psychrobacter sp.]
MYKNTKVIASLALAVLVTSTASVANAEISSNDKPMPKAFIGKWAGLHDTTEKLTKSGFKNLCETGGDQDTAIFVDFNSNGKQLNILRYWEDSYEQYPVTYSKYSPTHVVGQSLNPSNDFDDELGSDDDSSSNDTAAFDYKIVNVK